MATTTGVSSIENPSSGNRRTVRQARRTLIFSARRRHSVTNSRHATPAIKVLIVLNRQVVLASRPEGEPRPDDFRLAETPAPEPRDGQVLLRTLWLSLDPYMRGRMSAARSYAKPVEVGEPMVGGTVNEVVASKHPDFKPGDVVLGYAGWQDYAVSDGAGLRKLDAGRA